LGHLKNFTKYIGSIVPMKEQELSYYKEFAGFLSKYEENCEKTNVNLGSKENVRLVAGETQSHLKNKLETLASSLENPFLHIRNWIKGEMLGLGSLIAAISEKESCENRKHAAIKRLNDDRETVQKLSEGKFTLKHMFKSESSKVKQQTVLLEKINQTERDIENWETIKKFLIVYLAEVAIPNFKTSKLRKYIGAMRGFSSVELNNAGQYTNCWGDFFELTKAYAHI
jgi:hypothetical protein